MNLRRLYKNKGKPLFTIPINGSSKNGSFQSRKLEPQMVQFNQEQDLKVSRHGELLVELEKAIALTVKEIRRYSGDVVKKDISIMCQRTLNIIHADLVPIRVSAKQSKAYFERKLVAFSKNDLIEKYQDEYIRMNADDLQDRKNTLTTSVNGQQGRRHIILDRLKLLKIRYNECILKDYDGKPPKRRWYNS